MDANDMTVLRNIEDYENWDKLIEHCQVIEGLTDLEKEKAKRAFHFLRKEFGENFLKDAFNKKHPICNYLTNLAPWTRKWIIWFAEALKELKEQENYSSLLNRMKNENKFNEGLSVLEIAYKFSKAGFKIVMDPQIKMSAKEKVPDLKLIYIHTGEELLVEVSALGESKIVQDASQTMQKIITPLWRSAPFIYHCGRIHKTLSQRHLEEVVKKVEETVERAKKENSFQELVIEDVIEIGIAPENDKQMLEKWAVERGFKVGEFSGPSFNIDEIIRTKRAMEKEQKQLPHDHPNILIIKNNDLFFYTRDIRKLISELEEGIYEYPHLLLGIIMAKHAGMEENIALMKDQHVFVKKTVCDLLVEKYIMFLNRFCDYKISPEVITKIYNAFINY